MRIAALRRGRIEARLIMGAKMRHISKQVTAQAEQLCAGAGALGRPHGSHVYLKFKAAARALVKRCGGQEAASYVTRASHQTLARYGLPDDPSFMPIDIVADLEADAGCAEITRALADCAGFIVIPKPLRDGPIDPDWQRKFAAVATETSEAIARLAQALSVGGTITADEIRDLNLRGELREAMEALAEMDRALAKVEGGEGA